MQVETRTLSATTEPESAPNVRRRRSKRLSAVLIGMAIVAGASHGVLRHDGGSDGFPEPNSTTVNAEPAARAVIPFVVPPATGEGVSSVDG